MGKKYNNYSNKFVANKEEVIETTTLEQQPENNIEIENTQQEAEMPAQVNVAITGVVSGCEKLNVRKGPSKETDPVKVIDQGCDVIILEELPDWHKVRITGDDTIGYCMSEFITIK